MTRLLTPRLTLRHARADDLEALHRVLSDPRATAYWSTPPHESLDQTRAWMADMLEPGPGREDFVVELNGKVIGKAGFWRLPEVGYILHPDAWGRGLGLEAVGATIAHVFKTHDLDVLTADVDPRNLASLRLLERLGFQQTGSAERTFRIGDAWVDSLYFSLSRETWASRLCSRRATLDDVPRLQPLVHHAYRGERARAGWTHEADLLEAQRIDEDQLAESIGDPAQTILLAEEAGVLVGCVQVTDKGDGLSYLGMLTVDARRQAQGLGRRLLAEAEGLAQARFGATRMEMTVIVQRGELIEWYGRRGYGPTGERRPFPYSDVRFGLPRRGDLEFVVLEKRLGDDAGKSPQGRP